MKDLNDILKTINDAESIGIDTLGTQNVKRWIESVQKFEDKRNEDWITFDEFMVSLQIMKEFIKTMRVRGYFGNSPQKQEDLDKQFTMSEQLNDMERFVKEMYIINYPKD